MKVKEYERTQQTLKCLAIVLSGTDIKGRYCLASISASDCYFCLAFPSVFSISLIKTS